MRFHPPFAQLSSVFVLAAAIALTGCAAPAGEDADTAEGAASTGADRSREPAPRPTSPVAYVLVMENSSSMKELSHCTATALDRRTLLTSASCVDPVAFDPDYAPSKKYAVAVFFVEDPNDLRDDKVFSETMLPVQSTVLHPSWEARPPEERRAWSDLGASSGQPRPADALNVAGLVLDARKSAPVSIRYPELAAPANGPTTADLVGFMGTGSPTAKVLARRSLAIELDRDDLGGSGALLASVPKGLGAADSGGPALSRHRLYGILGRRVTVLTADAREADALSFAPIWDLDRFIVSVKGRAR